MSAATYIVHWPGQDTAACDRHAALLQSLADSMGFTVSTSLIVGEVPCANCETEREEHTADEHGTDPLSNLR